MHAKLEVSVNEGDAYYDDEVAKAHTVEEFLCAEHLVWQTRCVEEEVEAQNKSRHKRELHAKLEVRDNESEEARDDEVAKGHTVEELLYTEHLVWKAHCVYVGGSRSSQ